MPVQMLAGMANRHGLITGATGTGKTVSLQVMAEHFSALGVPVFLSDVKGDLAGLSQAGQASPKLLARLEKLNLPQPEFRAAPVSLWDVFGKKGHPLRATVSDMGPLLISRMLSLNEVQEGVLQLAFRIADESGLLILDAKDLRSIIQFVGDNAKSLRTKYGNISSASVGAIQRRLLALEDQGADQFFGEPMLNLADMMQTDINGRGVINVLAADQLLNSPRLYASFLLWMMSELFEELPEVGDPDKPRFVFFFDEAHLLFNEAPRALMEKVEQVVRLIRSKGVGIYFVTQNPLDVPNAVLGQLGNRIQHALRAYTPRDQKAVRAAAETMRQNPAFDAEAAISELGVGEGLLSFLDEEGQPSIVQRAFLNAPGSRIGPITDAERAQVMQRSVVAGIYDQSIDRESAHEMLQARAEKIADKPVEPAKGDGDSGGIGGPIGDILSGALDGLAGKRNKRSDSVFEAAAKSAARSIGSTLGRTLIRGVLGSLFKGR
ncbi:MAG: helicase HerA-like C-terminal domain-containing protein [Burkholderiaceae bacterium]